MRAFWSDRQRWLWAVLWGAPLLVLLVILQPAPRATVYPAQDIPLVVVAAPADPYYPLAAAIATAEAAPLVPTLTEGVRLSPAALVWVAAPARLSYATMRQAGAALLAAGNFPALGLVTASTLDGARALWGRGGQITAGPQYAVNARYPTASIFSGRILAMTQQSPIRQPLTLAGLQTVLGTAGYLTYTGHGGGRTWLLEEGVELTAATLPPLPGSLISAASCETFRPWGEESLALGFADRGVAAYSGFTFNPNEGNLLGQFDGLPYRYSWPDFPIGMVARVQVEGSLQVFATVPFYFTLGDPRLALQTAPPYRLVDERRTAHEWTRTYAAAPAGVIPVRLAGGADWPFVAVEGVGAVVDGSRSYHARVQTANLNGDKYLLFVHGGGDFTLRLTRPIPLWWRLSNPLTNAFDEAYLNSKINDIGNYIFVVALLTWPLVLWRRARQPGFRRALVVALMPALVVTLWRAGYGWLRVDETMINSKPLYFEPIWYGSGLLLTWAGALLWRLPRSRRSRAVGLGLAVLLPLFPGLFWALLFTLQNVMYLALHDVGGTVYHLGNALFEVTAAAAELPVMVALLTLTARPHRAPTA
jgi:hypothetical protein